MTVRDPRRSRDPARRAAADGLLAVDVEGAYLNLLLPRLLRERGLTGRDAAFATEIGYGAARRSGVLTTVLAEASGRSVADLDPPVRAVLVLGAYQLLHTRVPARAAVATGVELVREIAGPRPAGLVNAVLRRVSERSWEQWTERLAPDEPLARLAFVQGYPEWIARAFADALGGDLHEVAAALVDEAPTVHLAARPGRISRDELLAQAGPSATRGELSPYAVRLAGGDPSEIPAVRSGTAGVQDEGSQLVAITAAGAAINGADGGRWLDMCAGPGGKSALLEGLLPAGGHLIAADVAAHRARLVASALTGNRVIIADGRQPAWRDEVFDRVLLDAPCSGLGALRRRPEARWRKTPGDVAHLSQLQAQLLHRALDATRPGGVVAYATCSPHLAETRHVVDRVVAERADAVSTQARQLWPHRDGTDAMFVAILQRRSVEAT